MKRKLAPRRSSKAQKQLRPRGAVQTVVDETVGLYQWLAWVADELYGEDARGAARRWTLRRVMREGPQTVATLARSKPVRRQTLQPIVDALTEEGLVARAPNPSNTRSPLVAITRRGAALVARLDRVDVAVLRAVGRGIDEHALATTAATLRHLRLGFETKMRWQPAAAAVRHD